jgi:hypothetical protein
MKRLNQLLALAIVAVLLVPGFVVGAVVEACCGVQPTNLVVEDSPDPACLDYTVTISGKYTVIPQYTPFQPYATGIKIKVWAPDSALIVTDEITLDENQTTAPKDFPFSYDLIVDAVGLYRYEIVAWSFTYGREETDIVSGTILVEVCNEAPDCSNAGPSIGTITIWPPNHKFVAIEVLGVTDPDGDPVSITIDSIYQDEPVDTYGDGQFTPDGMGVGTSTAEVRAERAGTPAVPGNGRVYHIFFTADDGQGGSCEGEVMTGVPHDVKDIPVDDGALYDSTALAP